MRLRITNASSAPDETILPLIRFAAKFFNVAGTVRVAFRETRKRTGCQALLGGFCRYWNRVISVRSTLDLAHPQLPFSTETLGYFPGSKIQIQPYTLATPEEVIVHVAAHEFAHLMKAGQKFRKSRIEVFCENKATEILAAYRSDEGKAWIAAERARMTMPETEPKAPDRTEEITVKLAAIDARLKRWNSKAKRASNAIKKLTRQRNRLEKSL